MLLQLAQNLLPFLDWQQLTQLLLDASVPPDELLALSPEVAEGILGEEAAVYGITGTGNLPEDIHRTTVELQEAAARIRSKQTANQDQEGYWKASPVNQKWSKEVSHKTQHIHKHMFFLSLTSLVGVFFF